jgi:hypothetical protein
MLLFKVVTSIFLMSCYIFLLCYAFLLLCYVPFVSLSILIIMYVPFCVFRIIVLFCVLFVCKCVPDYCHRVSTQLQLNTSYSHDIRAESLRRYAMSQRKSMKYSSSYNYNTRLPHFGQINSRSENWMFYVCAFFASEINGVNDR